MSIPACLENNSKQNYSDQEVKNLTAEWVQHLDQMIVSFKMVLNSNTGGDPSIPYNEKIIQNGLDLFAKITKIFGIDVLIKTYSKHLNQIATRHAAPD